LSAGTRHESARIAGGIKDKTTASCEYVGAHPFDGQGKVHRQIARDRMRVGLDSGFSDSAKILLRISVNAETNAIELQLLEVNGERLDGLTHDGDTPNAQPVRALATSRPSPSHRTARHRGNDPRWKEIQDQLASQQKQIEAGRD
jgi:hypothetical protein